MMRIVGVAAVVAGAMSLAACNATTTKERFAAEREMLIGSPVYFAQQAKLCETAIRGDATKLKGAVLLTSLPAERAPKVLCERFLRAQRDGKLTYELHIAEMTNPNLTPEGVRIAQGR